MKRNIVLLFLRFQTSHENFISNFSIAWTRNFTFRDFELATRFLKQKSGNNSSRLLERWLVAWLKKNFFNRGKWMTLIA